MLTVLIIPLAPDGDRVHDHDHDRNQSQSQSQVLDQDRNQVLDQDQGQGLEGRGLGEEDDLDREGGLEHRHMVEAVLLLSDSFIGN